MPTSRPHAPADHFNPARAQVSDLNASVANLRSAMPLLSRVAAGAHHGMISACAALLAYLPAHAIGLKESFWSAITAISVSQTEFRAARTTARDQFIGATVGGLTGLCTFLAFGESVIVYAFAVVLAMLVCAVLNVGSASRLAGITATIILLVPRTGSPAAMFLARLSEVGWGLCVSVTIVWLAGRLPARTLSGTSRADGR
jgi:uncharacterized membrane protein YgaE (UPF0421/DUF939 family)